MKTVTITCDGCGKNLTVSKSSGRFRLALSPQLIEHTSKGDDVGTAKPSTDLVHFCDLTCLDRWIKTKKT